MTIIHNEDENLWVEKYRPKSVSECILKPSMRKEFDSILEKGHIPNMLFQGPPGTGKTTLAKALCNDLGMDYMMINASNERGLDVIREKITNFASTVSFTDKGKCFILDEADQLLGTTQAALRSASEEFSKSCSFIMTANYPNRIIPALHSRFVSADFGIDAKAMEEMQAQFFMRCLDILSNENVECDEAVLIRIIQKFFPDNRKIIGLLQKYGRHGKIDEGILMDLEEVNIDALIEAIKSKKFKQIMQWSEDNKDNDLSSMYEKLYKSLKQWVEPTSIPDAIVILEDAQRFDSTVASKELHLAAMCTELMTSLSFR